MFVPFGYLVPATNPKYLRKWSFAMMGGLVASTVIEGCQMLFLLGQSDVDDIIANTFGAVIGYALARFVWQFRGIGEFRILLSESRTEWIAVWHHSPSRAIRKNAQRVFPFASGFWRNHKKWSKFRNRPPVS